MADVLPPWADRLNREGRRIVVDPDADTAGVGGEIINSVRHGAAELLDQEIVHAHFLRVALHAPLAAGVLEIADQFLLLGIDGDRWLVLGHGRLDRVVDDVELRVAVGIVSASRVLLLACRLNFCFFSNSPTTVWLILCRACRVQRPAGAGSCTCSAAATSDRRACRARPARSDHRANRGSFP